LLPDIFRIRIGNHRETGYAAPVDGRGMPGNDMRMIRFLVTVALMTPALFAGVEVDVEAFGSSLGGWKARSGKAADYEISDSGYRTYKPEVTPTPDGGIFVSVRIDLRRGWLASDDHASLEMAFGPDAKLVSAQSSLALQGRVISSAIRPARARRSRCRARNRR